MNILIFDKKMETGIFVSGILHKKGNDVTIAQSSTEFLYYILHQSYDVIVISKKELEHHCLTPMYFEEKISWKPAVFSYSYDDDFISDISVVTRGGEHIKHKAGRIKHFMGKCTDPNAITTEIIYNLPRKQGILLKHLVLNKNTGLTGEEIAKLFWGDIKDARPSGIYAHVYNLRKRLQKRFNGVYVIYKERDLYRLINTKKALNKTEFENDFIDN